jgi:hypothetical protein
LTCSFDFWKLGRLFCGNGPSLHDRRASACS